jgi:hypothetical protein
MPNTYTRKHMIMPLNNTKIPIKDAGVRVKVAWAAVKRDYKKKGDKWVKKE